MRKNILLPIVLVTLSMFVNSCKPDDPIVDSPDINQEDTSKEKEIVYSNYFSFSEESWICSGSASYRRDLGGTKFTFEMTKTKDTLISYQDTTYTFCKMAGTRYVDDHIKGNGSFERFFAVIDSQLVWIELQLSDKFFLGWTINIHHDIDSIPFVISDKNFLRGTSAWSGQNVWGVTMHPHDVLYDFSKEDYGVAEESWKYQYVADGDTIDVKW